MKSRMVAGLRAERKELETKHQRLQGVQRKLQGVQRKLQREVEWREQSPVACGLS